MDRGACNKSVTTEATEHIPGGPVVRTLQFHCWGSEFDQGMGTKIPQAVWHGQKKKEEEEEEEEIR